MTLADFLKQGARQAATRSVSFKVVGQDSQARALVADARAELAPLSEHQRQEALREAERALRETYYKDPIPDARRDDEGMYHVLTRALRDPDDPRRPFADSVRELKGALVLAEAARLWSAYVAFLDEEFPDIVDAETFEKLVDAAKKVSLIDLISSFGYDVVSRSIGGLLSRLRT